MGVWSEILRDSQISQDLPVWFAERGIKIDVPMLLRQGISDNLFNLNQGIKIFDRALTAKARSQSYLVGYNGGHALPNVLPAGTAAGDDACSGNFTTLTIRFFRQAFAGRTTDGLLPARYNLTTADGTGCLRSDSLGGQTPLQLDPLGSGDVIATAGLGGPLHLPLAEGPLTIAGIPKLAGTLTSIGLDARAFFGLSIGTTPADARVIQNNVMPLHQMMPVQDQPFAIELPGVAVEVPEGQSLFLTVSPVADMYVGHGSRTPGSFRLTGVGVRLPGAARTRR